MRWVGGGAEGARKRRQGAEVAEREGGSGSWKETREGRGTEGSIPPRVERGSSVDALLKTGEVRIEE